MPAWSSHVDPFAAQLLALILGLATIVVFSVAQDAFLARQRKPDAATIAALIDRTPSAWRARSRQAGSYPSASTWPWPSRLGFRP